MDERKAFSFYRSYYEAAKDLPTKEDQADFLMAICSYIFDDGVEPKITGVASAMFKLAKPNLDTSIKRASVGQTGGKSKANAKQNGSKPEANAKQNGSKPEANDKQTESNDEANPKRYMINDYMINDQVINDQVINDKEKINKKEKQRTTSAVVVAKKLISDFAGDDKDLEAALNDFLSMRKKIKKPLTDRALQQRLKKLQELSGASAVALEYDAPVSAESLTPASYEVAGREISRVRTGKSTDKCSAKEGGNFVIIELKTSVSLTPEFGPDLEKERNSAPDKAGKKAPPAGMKPGKGGPGIVAGGKPERKADPFPIEAEVRQALPVKAADGRTFDEGTRMKSTASKILIADDFRQLSYKDDETGVIPAFPAK